LLFRRQAKDYFPILSHRIANDDIIDIDTEQGKFYAQKYLGGTVNDWF
jgi:hypothetical protein